MILADFRRFSEIRPIFTRFRGFSINPYFLRPISWVLVGFGSSQEIRLEKNCQGMPSDPDLEPWGSESVTKPYFWKVQVPACRPSCKAMSGRSCLEGHVWKAIWKAIFEGPSNDAWLAKTHWNIQAKCFGNKPFSFFPAKSRTLEKRHAELLKFD